MTGRVEGSQGHLFFNDQAPLELRQRREHMKH